MSTCERCRGYVKTLATLAADSGQGRVLVRPSRRRGAPTASQNRCGLRRGPATVASTMGPLLTAAMLLVAGGFFGFTMLRRVAPLLALRRVNRLDNPAGRVAGLLRFGFGQRRMVDPEELRAGLMHVVLFAAFLLLALRTVTLFGVGFSEGFHLPLLAPDAPFGRVYGFAKDVMVLGALAAAAGFLWRRLVTKPDRVTLSWEGNLILAFICGLMLTDMMFDGAGMVAAGEPAAWWAPSGSLAAAAYRSLGLSAAAVGALGQAGFWAHLAIILVFGNLLPYGKHFHIITALPNVYLRALPPAAAALRKLDLESEAAEYGAQTAKDLSWKEALDVYSCTECGRCQTHCPTYVTGKPLSHKEVNRALRHHVVEKAPELVALHRAREPAAREAAAALGACRQRGGDEAQRNRRQRRRLDPDDVAHPPIEVRRSQILPPQEVSLPERSVPLNARCPIRPQRQRPRSQRRRRLLEVAAGGGVDAPGAAAEIDRVEIDFERLVLAQRLVDA